MATSVVIVVVVVLTGMDGKRRNLGQCENELLRPHTEHTAPSSSATAFTAAWVTGQILHYKHTFTHINKLFIHCIILSGAIINVQIKQYHIAK